MQNFDTGGFLLENRHTVRREPQLDPELKHMLAVAKTLIFFGNMDLTISNLVFPMAKTTKGVTYRQFVADPRLHNLGFISNEDLFTHEYSLDEKPIIYLGRIFNDCKVVIDENKQFYRLLNNGKREDMTPAELRAVFYKDTLEMHCKYHVWNKIASAKQWEDLKASYRKQRENW